MKINLFIRFFVLIAIFFNNGCTAPKAVSYERSGKVISQEYEEGVIHLVSEASAESLDKAVSFAERNAVENLLFKGIPNSNQEKPMVPNEIEALQSHPEYFKSLIKNGRFQRFVMKSEVLSNSNENRIYYIKQKISIDLNALRSDLEQNKIVRKFGL